MTGPRRDEQIVWAESNAVVYANSVLGARTMKYPDYLDIAIALTGRAPKAGCHLPEERAPQVRVTVPPLEGMDDSLWPLHRLSDRDRVARCHSARRGSCPGTALTRTR